jgi:perosamine synthetase
MFEKTIAFIREIYATDAPIPLHAPVFFGNEKKYLNECIDSTFVSSVGKFVDRFEKHIAAYTGAKYAIATVNGTAALHIALKLAGANKESEVITQALTFVATCNAISYCGARPVFVDVDKDSMGLSPESLKHFLISETMQKEDGCYNRKTGKRIAAVVPVHTFGQPCRIEEIAELCAEHRIALVEDAAESLGSYYGDRHTGTFGVMGIFSFNGNKTITTGGGGVIVTDNAVLAEKAKHLTTTAKVDRHYEFLHDSTGYNYRLPNLNAALGCAQMETLTVILEKKRELAQRYLEFFKSCSVDFLEERRNTQSNYWLNTLVMQSPDDRDQFLEETNQSAILCRPVWRPMHHLDMFSSCQSVPLPNTEWLEKRVVNIPSGVTL